MANSTYPLSSFLGGIEFGRMADEEVKRLSVKRIHVTPTLDSMNGPMPGGVHDLALGAISALDANCATCRMSFQHCPGHCGHIELPTQVYHPQYIDQTLRLLRAKCIYCHSFRIPANTIHYTICQLRLLQYGLIKEYHDLARYRLGSKRKKQGDDEMEVDDYQEDLSDLMDRRDNFVTRSIRRAKNRGNDPSMFLQNSIAIQARKDVIANFLQIVALQKKCTKCHGITPSYRKDRASKIFRKPLPARAKELMRAMDKFAPNPLLFLIEERKQKEVPAKKHALNGHADEDEEMLDIDVDTHGAEEEIATRNAMEAQSSSKSAELDGEMETQAYMTPAEVHAALTLLFEREQEVVDLLFAPLPGRKHVKVSADMFFISNILVPPNKFRPLARQGPNAMLENAMNSPLNKVINAANDLKLMMRNYAKTEDSGVRRPAQTQLLSSGVALQELVNALIDNPPGPTNRGIDQGIKQVLEKKEGLFRMNMMGKRVNYAARSVISPDPNIETNEIGVPLVFAKKLTYPEPVTSYNYEALSRAVINGVDEYPGASAIENELGQVMSLRRKTKDQRRALAKQLMTSTAPGVKGENCKKVYRHLQTGDVVIMNRQPTLHKPSMMGHRARVLKNEKTIRMHYANCNTYNADFDGDEMNMHFPQNELARAEALQIADTDHQYLSATAGKPLRGLIQDHISMAVQFTSRDTFYNKEQYHELLYNCLRPEDYNTVHDRILTVPPAIIKPQRLWTGKQVITTVLMNIVPSGSCGINLTGKSQTSADHWGEKTVKSTKEIKVTPSIVQHVDTEQTVIFRDGQHLCGILDKGQIGPANGGLIHSVHELYGHIVAGKLLSILGRLLTRVLNERAWSCGMEDLYLTKEGDAMRRRELSNTAKVGHNASVEYVNLDPRTTTQDSKALIRKLEDVLRNDEQLNTLDQLYKTSVKSITDAVGKVMPEGLHKPFPRNQMQAMTVSGAKGSGVNAALISCVLGQQVLEGRRVPTMVSGKTLPLFRAFETHPVAGGYVMGRFLTGIKPAEYYFHAMSGREGLIDTAVKTAKSGYLQRCIIKGLEGLKTEYDTSVREASNGTVVQFLYGEDGLEVTKQKHLKEFTFLAENNQTVTAMMRADEIVPVFKENGLQDMQKNVMKAVKKGQDVDPLLTLYPPANNFGSVSESFSSAVNNYCKDNPDKLIRDKKANVEGLIGKKTFQSVLELKYMRSVVDAGEAVGVVAAQSVGEPSTQMTLNTFHLAGHSAKNVTLGIPRLREIIMTATSKPITPTMTLKTDVPPAEAEKFAKSISKLALSDVIKDMSVTESSRGAEKLYDIRLAFYPPEEYCEEYNIQVADVARSIQTRFLPLLHKMMRNEFKKKAKEATLSVSSASVPQLGVSVGTVEQERSQTTRTAEREGGEDDIDEDADMDDAKDAAGRSRRNDDFDEPDDDEARLADQESQAGGDDEEDEEQKKRFADGDSQAHREQNADDSDNDSDSGSDRDEVGLVTDTDPDSDDEAKLDILVQKIPHLKSYRFSKAKGKSCHLTLSYDSNTPKLLLLPMLEKCARTAVIQNIPGLDMCTMYMEDVLDPNTSKPVTRINPDTKQEEVVQEPVITTQGVNLIAIRELQDVVDPHTIYTNSVHDMLKFYGVEAARATIAKEISAVFIGHGISVDNRHISLIADAMTQSGGYKAFSRHGLVHENGSILAKMSFETVMGFLKEAVLFGEADNLKGPSARIVAGRRGGVGTGSFDVVVPV